jgi:hypothetical protein
MSGERWPVLEDLSRHDNISRERVRQIEVRAFEKCRKTIRIAVLQQRRGWQNLLDHARGADDGSRSLHVERSLLDARRPPPRMV